MDEILESFKSESQQLLSEMLEILDDVEEDESQLKRLEDYGQRVDRIMGGAQTINLDGSSKTLGQISAFAELCKLIGYKCSQVEAGSELALVTVAFLQDATELLDEFVGSLGEDSESDIKSTLSSAFKDRLEMIAERFDESLRATVGNSATESKKNTQSQIDELMAKFA